MRVVLIFFCELLQILQVSTLVVATTAVFQVSTSSIETEAFAKDISD
jgi:hypothetical protein